MVFSLDTLSKNRKLNSLLYRNNIAKGQCALMVPGEPLSIAALNDNSFSTQTLFLF